LGSAGRTGNFVSAIIVCLGVSIFYSARGSEHLFDFNFCSVPLEIEKIEE
jgi:hypothetical protein